MTGQAPHERILQMTYTALVVQRAVYAAVELGIPDLLADGAQTSEEIAEATRADRDATYRLMRALASAGLLTETDGRSFSLSELGAALRSGVEGSMRGWVLFSGSPPYMDAWREILTAVRTGKPVWEGLHGSPFFDYLRHHPDAAAAFDAAMTSLSAWEVKAVLDAYDFSSSRVVIDVGGGQGALLAAILKASPATRGVLFDQPQTVAGASAALADQGVSDRCEIVGGDFFESVPPGGDTYLLKYVVHDWDDESAVRILSNCRRAMPQDGKVLLVETVVPGPEEPDYAKIADLEMLLLLGSRERTVAEFEQVLSRAGLALTGVVPTSGYLEIVEAEAAQCT